MFFTEPEPARATLLPVLPGVHRIVADNPGRMTYRGTNTYLIEASDGVTILDPGPDDPAHVADIMRLAPGRIALILLSHTHRDHFGATPALRAATGAPVAAFHVSADPAFTADILLQDGDGAAGLRAVHTPGHAADHVCFARDDGVLFSADHVMAWSSSVVSPPNGNMADYFASLELMLTRTDTLYLPGHGPALADPAPYVRNLLKHRQLREAEILRAVGIAPRTTIALVDALYSKIDPILRLAAERNVIAHLQKLEREGRARLDGDVWMA